jgi:hypothetical protein
MKAKDLLTGLSFYGLWLLLAAMWAVVLFQLQVLILFLGILVIETPWLRPTGWNSETLKGIERCGFFVMGSLWLGLVLFSERHLRKGVTERRFWRHTLQLILVGGGIYGLSTGLLYLLG